LQDLAVFVWKIKCYKVNKNNTVPLHTKHCCSLAWQTPMQIQN